MSLRIYTRSGDDGETGLFGGQRVPKDDFRIEACGSVDELNAHLGLVLACCGPESANLMVILTHVQHDLFAVGADLSTPGTESRIAGGTAVERIGPDLTTRLEGWIDAVDAGLPPLSSFILPGGSPMAARLHVCRAICRRAERRVVCLSQRDATNLEIVRYLNRLSDLLFVLARAANVWAGVEDVPWVKSGPARVHGSAEENA